MVFGLLRLLGFDYRPQLADLPDTKLWRIDPTADYGLLSAAARGRIDLGRVRQHWGDILRLVASIHTGAVSAHDVIRMLAPAGKSTQLGDALAHYGRIFKTLHVLAYVDDEAYRRQIKGMRNLQEGRHDMARHVFHGGKGELRQHYHEGMEDQLGALGLVLNCVTLWNTVYLDAALDRLRADGYPARDQDVARLSPYMRRHLNVHGHYSFQLPQRQATERSGTPTAPMTTPTDPTGREGVPVAGHLNDLSLVLGSPAPLAPDPVPMFLTGRAGGGRPAAQLLRSGGYDVPQDSGDRGGRTAVPLEDGASLGYVDGGDLGAREDSGGEAVPVDEGAELGRLVAQVCTIGPVAEPRRQQPQRVGVVVPVEVLAVVTHLSSPRSLSRASTMTRLFDRPERRISRSILATSDFGQ